MLLSQRGHKAQCCRLPERRKTQRLLLSCLSSLTHCKARIGASCQLKRPYLWSLSTGIRKACTQNKFIIHPMTWFKNQVHINQKFLKSQHNFRFHHHFLKVPSGKTGLSPHFKCTYEISCLQHFPKGWEKKKLLLGSFIRGISYSSWMRHLLPLWAHLQILITDSRNFPLDLNQNWQ